jgi:adenylate kinase
MLRTARKEGSELGKKVAAIMDAGQLVPDEVVIDLVAERLARPDHSGGVILDGFPRTIKQAEALDELFKRTGRDPLRVIVVDVPEDEIRRRLGGRTWCTRCKRTFHQTDNPPTPLPSDVQAGCDVVSCPIEVRSDDRPEAIEKRLVAYAQLTSPLIEYYKNKGAFSAINGLGKIPDIFQSILSSLGQ